MKPFLELLKQLRLFLIFLCRLQESLNLLIRSWESTPELVNDDPYGAGWMIKIKLSNPDEISLLLDSKGYEELIKGE